ncbi:MAG: amidohydrolase family protein [candidate division WOR-3 bacterium]
MKRRDFLKAVGAGALGVTLGGPSLPGLGEAKTQSDRSKRAAQGPARSAFHTIDAFTHISTMDFISLLENLAGVAPNPFRALFEKNLPLIDPTQRIKAMDAIGATMHILLPLPYLESSPQVYSDRAKALQAAQFINDAVARVVAQYPDRFLGVAMLPTLNADDMLSEFERAVTQLRMVGGFFVVSPLSKPPDHPDYLRLYAKACDLDVPLWIHPARAVVPPDYAGEPTSKYNIWMTIGWPMDTSVAMTRIVFSGVFDTYPNLKLITHHRGAFIPFWFNRINEIVLQQVPVNISKPYIKHFQKFYIDTACSGIEPDQMKMAYKFFGPEHTLFGTDTPLDGEGGARFYRYARESLSGIGLSKKILTNIYSANVLKIIRRS